MLFNSYTFWIFFLAVLVLNRLLSHKWQNRMLLAASYIFYGAWDWRFLTLIVWSTLLDYVVALAMEKCSQQERVNSRKRWLLFSMVTNLGLLAVFKYYGFFAQELERLLGSLGVEASPPVLKIALPVGISFYTFQTMSYVIDVYRGRLTPTRNVIDFALYVAFFPQLVAGPIERSTHLMPQVVLPRRLESGDVVKGFYWIIYGLFLKVVVADNMAAISNGVFQQSASELSGLDCLLGVYAFAFQIYGDFAGYSAIARGTAKWLGFNLMVNFDLPYFAQSLREFWRRWHISLSTWLRDYLYIPLGGNRRGTLGTCRNLMITMLLGGLWHGAGWTFLCWGLVHGILLCAEHVLSHPNPDAASYHQVKPRLLSLVNMILTFHLVCLTWLLFRSENIHQAWSMLELILTRFHVTQFSQFAATAMAFYLLPLLIYEYWLLRCGDLERLVKARWPIRAGVYSYAVVMLILFQPVTHHEFIYFQF